MTDQEVVEPVPAIESDGSAINFKEVQDLARRVGKTMSGKSETEVLAWLDAGDTPADAPAVRPAGLPAASGHPGDGVDLEEASNAAEAAQAATAGPGEESPDADPGDAAPRAQKPGDEPPADPADESTYETALRALRRAKTPTAVIRGMPREQVVAWGLELARVQAGADQAFTRLRELESSEQPAENPSGGQTNAPETADATDEAHLEELTEALGLDKEGGEVLAKALKARDARVQSELAKRDQRDKLRDKALADLVLQGARNQLRDRFPSLANREQAKAVDDKARALFRSGGYETVLDAMEDAASLVLKDDVKAASEKAAAAKARGRTTPPTARPSRPANQEDRFAATLVALESGQTREQAAQAGGW